MKSKTNALLDYKDQRLAPAVCTAGVMTKPQTWKLRIPCLVRERKGDVGLQATSKASSTPHRGLGQPHRRHFAGAEAPPVSHSGCSPSAKDLRTGDR